MKNKLYISIGLLLVLVLFYIINVNQQKNYQSTSNQIFNFNKEQVNKFLIKSESTTIEIQKVDTSWVIANNDSLTLKENVLNTFFDKIFSLESETMMTKNTEKWSKYNIDDMRGTHLIFYNTNNDVLGIFVFGKSSSDFSRCYIRFNDKPEVFLVNQNIMYSLQIRPEYWGEKNIEETL
tara:strand:+ start:600 stop:1136 length:537 start_codon:yes stop_codon:yes gene_type:complete